MNRIALPLLLAVGLVGCIDDRPEQQTAARPDATEEIVVPAEPAAQDLPDDVARAVRLARQLDENPSLDVPTMLQTEALTQEELDDLLYEIAADPEKTRQYMQARRPSPAGAPTTELPQDRLQ